MSVRHVMVLVLLTLVATRAQASRPVPSEAPATSTPNTEPAPTRSMDAPSTNGATNMASTDEAANAPSTQGDTDEPATGVVPPPLLGADTPDGARPTSVDAQQKDRGGRVWLGLLIGGAAGAGAGYLLGASGVFGACAPTSPGADDFCPYVGTIVGAGGLLVGGLLGTIIGAELDSAARKKAGAPNPASDKAVRSLTPRDAGVRLMPAVGVSAQGAYGGVIGRF